MATYNRAHFIKETLISIQNQTFENWECIIIDDGGTDNTKDIIKSILQNDTRFQFVKRSESYQKGLPGCRNFGLDLAKGNFIIFFDDDDIIHPDNLKIGVETLKDSDFSFCHYQKLSFEVDQPSFVKIETVNKKTIKSNDLEKVITQKIGLASCTVLWNNDCFKTLRFNEKLMYAEEWECYTRIISEGYTGVIIDAVLYFNRKHPNSNTAEFYNNNPIRKESKNEAILLVIKNLHEKELLTDSLLRYFIQMALDFKAYKLFESILTTIKLSFAAQIKWKIFYSLLPLRLKLFKFKKRLVKK
jgi:glycosyltransferase involved in cell wall biosynthesis